MPPSSPSDGICSDCPCQSLKTSPFVRPFACYSVGSQRCGLPAILAAETNEKSRPSTKAPRPRKRHLFAQCFQEVDTRFFVSPRLHRRARIRPVSRLRMDRHLAQKRRLP